MKRRVAYFSMEVGLENSLPTYSGGLGILAGDTLRAAADVGIPMVGVTLVHRKGYFRQRLDEEGNQREEPADWRPEDRLIEVEPRVQIQLSGRTVHVRAWRYDVRGHAGAWIPVYLLDTNLPENAPEDRAITDHLYGGDEFYRLSQEAVLGLGGIAMLRALGHDSIRIHHMNEGHSALLAIALLEQEPSSGEAAIESVRRRCVFTTHTPVPAGHDCFPLSLVRDVLGPERANTLCAAGGCTDGTLNMTHFALHLSHFLNGVAMRHREVSRSMFPDFFVNSITNGVHAGTWVSPPFRALFDHHIPEWRDEAFNLRYAVSIPLGEIRGAHRDAKHALLAEVHRRTGIALDPAVLTIGFARRATSYKRAGLLFSDMERLRRISRQVGPLQILFAGKAHPHDEGGKAVIRRVFNAARALGDLVRVVYLEDYDMDLAGRLVAGVDVWLNTPQKPQEASGTSGMKAALNGVPSLSVLDGWWIEGHVEGVTGWSIGETWELETDRDREPESLYQKLEEQITPLYYARPDAFAAVMRSAISLNGSFFNAERMILQYATHAYSLPMRVSRDADRTESAGEDGAEEAVDADRGQPVGGQGEGERVGAGEPASPRRRWSH